MLDLKASLPDFDRPPVVEVVLSVQFQRLSGMQVAHFGLFWAAIRDRFPRTQSHPVIDPVTEAFEGPPLGRPAVRFEVVQEMMPPRAWFLSKDGDELIQVQHDRFIFNWRKVKASDQYPRYPHVRQRFIEEFQCFESFVREQELGSISPNQCEVTYVNQVESGAGWEHHGDVAKVLALWNPAFQEEDLPALETARVALQYVIPTPGSEGAPAGRLHVDFQPGVRRSDDRRVFAMNLTARGAPIGNAFEGVIDFFDLGRAHIVRGFKALTSTKMHHEWGIHE